MTADGETVVAGVYVLVHAAAGAHRARHHRQLLREPRHRSGRHVHHQRHVCRRAASGRCRRGCAHFRRRSSHRVVRVVRASSRCRRARSRFDHRRRPQHLRRGVADLAGEDRRARRDPQGHRARVPDAVAYSRAQSPRPVGPDRRQPSAERTHPRSVREVRDRHARRRRSIVSSRPPRRGCGRACGRCPMACGVMSASASTTGSKIACTRCAAR